MTDRETHPPLDRETDEALDWFLRLQDPDLPASEKAAFAAWRAGDPARAAAFVRVAGLWEAPEFAAAVARQAKPAAASHRPARHTWLRAATALAASVVLLLGLGQAAGLLTPYLADYATAVGQRQEIRLSDGSLLVLNSGSAVDVEMTAAGRNIRLLRGEAYFDVTHDPARPFRVTAGYARVEVVGTAFTVETGPDLDRVTVERGQVAVSPAGQTQAVQLQADQAVSVTALGAGPTEEAAAEVAFAWREGRIRFDQRPLREVVAELGRYYGGGILIGDPRLADIAVSGDYRLDDPAAIVASLAQAVGAEVTRLPGAVLLIRPAAKNSAAGG